MKIADPVNMARESLILSRPEYDRQAASLPTTGKSIPVNGAYPNLYCPETNDELKRT
jgi:hypothetical protein